MFQQNQEKIFNRSIIPSIVPFLDDRKIIVLHGARQVGKTHILYSLRDKFITEKRQWLYIDLEDEDNLMILDQGVDSFLNYLQSTGLDFDSAKSKGEQIYIMIDEIQYLQKPSNFMKLLVDHHSYLKIIVSGSSTFNIKTKFTDSLVGRTVAFEVFPLSFIEFLQFKQVDIKLEFANSVPTIKEKLIDLYQEYMLYGGYPDIVLANSLVKKEAYLKQIKQTYVDKDIKDLANIREVGKFNILLKLLAERSGQLLNIREIAELTGLNRATLEKYIFILENTYVIKLVRPYSNIAQNEVIKMPKVFFYDTGLMQIIWFRKLNTAAIGNIFETSVFSELVKKYDKDIIHFWRTKNQEEVDFILDLPDGLLPIEVKLTLRESDLAGIKKFTQKYKIGREKIVGLYGNTGNTSLEMIYPWEL